MQGKGIDLPVRSRRQTTLQVQTRTQKKKKEKESTLARLLSLWGYKLVLLLLREAVSVCSGRQMKGSRWRGNVAVLPL